jgi:hypothetical protein
MSLPAGFKRDFGDIVEDLRGCLANDVAPDRFLIEEVIREIELLRKGLEFEKRISTGLAR